MKKVYFPLIGSVLCAWEVLQDSCPPCADAMITRSLHGGRFHHDHWRGRVGLDSKSELGPGLLALNASTQDVTQATSGHIFLPKQVLWFCLSSHVSGYRKDQILVKVIMLINACKINITQKSHSIWEDSTKTDLSGWPEVEDSSHWTLHQDKTNSFLWVVISLCCTLHSLPREPSQSFL